MSTVTCHSASCPNEGQAIPLKLDYTDEESGEVKRVESVQCGGCGRPITDIVDD